VLYGQIYRVSWVVGYTFIRGGADSVASRETLYGAFKPRKGTNKYLLYQWTLPEGPARHVPESVAHTCMAERCERHFGLLGR
jgi:hypothetical protein